ncbi:transposase [Klebsiella pneumoniae]|nr:transposase [Klebsiella pneumoniae]
MRMVPVRLSARGKVRLIKKRSVKPRRPKQYRPVKTGELIGMDAIELRMGDLRRYIITMIDEHSDYALALAVPSLNSDITSHFFSKATKLFPVAIKQVVTDNGKEFLGNFDKTLQEASIKHIWTYPYTPKMNATCERFNRTLREQFIEFNELLLFEDLNLFNQRMAEYLVLYNSKRPHKSLELMTPVDYILRESKNCNMWWTHTAKQKCHHRCETEMSCFGSENAFDRLAIYFRAFSFPNRNHENDNFLVYNLVYKAIA